MGMRFKSTLALAIFMIAGPADAGGERPFAIAKTYEAADGSYDYVSVDEDTGRVFVGREYGVMTIDPMTGKTATLLAREGVAAVLPIAGTRLMLSTNGPLDTATLFDRDSGAVTADIATGKDPDGAYYDVASRLAFVMNGDSGDVTVIDVAGAKAIAAVAIGGTPEGATSDGKGRLFVNVEDLNNIAVIDIAARRVSARYALANCEEPTGIAYDKVSDTLIAACRNGVASLVDAATGRSRGTIATGQGADGSLFDPASRTGFVPCIDGTLTIYRLDGRGKATVIQTLKTREGARTAAHDVARGRVYLPFAKVDRDAAGKYLGARTGFGVLVVAR
jgi:YVTN family beta-propeller protein